MKKSLIILSLLCVHTFLAFAYKIGDVIINPDGSEGVVFHVNSNGRSGLMVALNDIGGKVVWGTNVDIPSINNVSGTTIRQFSDTACYANTLAIRNFYPSNSGYPAFLVDFNNGWCLPTATQLNILYSHLAIIRPKLLNAGGSDLQKDYYWSSSENAANYAISFSFKDGYFVFAFKSSTLAYVRAVRNFDDTEIFQYDSTLSYQWNTGETTPYIKPSPNKTTTYTVIASNKFGCSDSISKTIFVANNQTDTINASICMGETYTDNGFTESNTGTYLKSETTKEGCTLSKFLNLTVFNLDQTEFSDTVQTGTIYSNYGFYFTAPIVAGNYTDSILYKNKNGCDSIVILKLFVKDEIVTYLSDKVCQGETYAKNGFNLEKQEYLGEHVYERTLKTVGGCCDSTIVLELQVNKASFSGTEVIICAGDTVSFNGNKYSETGYYASYFTNSLECDSVATLRLTVVQPSSSITNSTICMGNTYSFNGKIYSTEGTYSESLTNSRGCDSTATLILKIAEASSSSTEASICEGGFYLFNGSSYNSAGSYVANLTNSAGCDSIATLNLHVNKPSASTTYGSICNGNSYNFNGSNYNSAGTYTAHLTNAGGCDSVATLILQVGTNTSSTTIESICEGESFNFNGTEYSSAGTYSYLLHNSSGCDSTAVLELSIRKNSAAVTEASICSGEQFFFEGNNYNTSGTYSKHFINSVGCDSVSTLNLKVNLITNNELHVTIKQGETYIFNGQELDSTGVYTHTLSNVNSCDSIITLYLSINKSVIIPVGFSPNGDGVNDYFKITNIESFPLNNILIFNRWGNKLYEGNPYRNEWDGKNHFGGSVGDDVLPDGTYFYILNLGDGSPDIKGYVYLKQ